MKILILYASAGAGHKKAAEALRDALREKSTRPQIQCLEALRWTPFLFRVSYPRLYLWAINRLPLVWGLFYYLLDNKKIRPLVVFLRGIFNRINSGPLIRYLREQSPDIVICTHFFPAEVICRMKVRGGFKTRLIIVITDLWPHYFWVLPQVDEYMVGLDLTRRELIKRDIPEEKITVTGIPINPVFNICSDRKNIRKKLDLAEGLFTVLIVSGGFGTGPMRQIIRGVDRVDKPLQIIVVCGYNEALLKRLKNMNFRHKVKPLGFVHNMHELMAAADVAVSKAGGLTVSEALAKKLPLIIIRPVPGQETKNSQALEVSGCALRAKYVSEVKNNIEELIAIPDKLERMRRHTSKLARPDSAHKIAEAV